MNTPVYDFSKCPSLDADLHAWALMFPVVAEKIFGDYNYKEVVFTLANLKNIDPDNKAPGEYGFTEEQIKTAIEVYKPGDYDQDEITKYVKEARETDLKERLYANNLLKPWSDYEVPEAEKGYYKISNHGIYRYARMVNEETGAEDFIRKDVCRTPFVLCGMSRPLSDENIYYKIRYQIDEKNINEFWASQSDLLSRKELKTLFLKKGINCPESVLLLETIEYLSRSIADFGLRLKKEFSAKQNGWSDDKSIFVLGDRAISARGVSPILYVGAGKGFPEIECKGTLEGWLAGTRGILEYDLIRFKCYDALTAPLKSILGVESHATDHYGNTSCGKTFSAQIALSMIGDAEELTIGAKSTAKGILVHIRDFSDLPILIDESSDAGEHLADLVYPLTSNKGRVKSTVDGQRDGGEEFHTSTMFTGERPIRDCLQNSGQQYRVNELDDTLPDLPTKEINAVKKAIRDNHGHIIELYIKKVFEWRENGNLQITYDNCFDALPENTSNIEGRSRAIFACIMTAGKILETVFKEIGMPKENIKNPYKIVSHYFKKCIQEKPVELEYIRALRVVLDWINSDYGRFAAGDVTSENVILNDKNKLYGYVDLAYIDIIGTEFTKKIKDSGFSPSKIKEDWWNQGISESNDTVRKGTYRFKRGGKTIAGVRINRTVAENLLDVRHEIETIAPKDQDEKIKRIFKIIEFLTDLDGSAKINAIRVLANIPDIDEQLSMICNNSKKIMKISQDDFVYVY